ncbi:hypothetical protein [Catellatospora sp. NPDC049609]|uniref:hypothetical protein n=1 Tax=Catellatospora sp. NPDC049609 TaxID=3155505 RepID=UPI00343F6D40
MSTYPRAEWTDVHDGDTWRALRLDLPAPGPCGLRVEVTGGRRILLRQNGSAIVAARVAQGMSHVDYLRGDGYRPVVPPVRAEHARRLAQAAGGVEKWAYHFASTLAASQNGPLHAGRWLLEPSAPRLWLQEHRHISVEEQWRDIVVSDPAGEIDWYLLNGAAVILCLRDLSAADQGRVKAYRKQVRGGTVAPILLWWISGLTSYLLLDGHDRLQACLAEGAAPPVLTLSRLADDAGPDVDLETARHTATARHIERAVAHGVPGAAEALIAERRRFGKALEEQLWAKSTRAWTLPGAVEAWRSAARAMNSTWLAAVDPDSAGHA